MRIEIVTALTLLAMMGTAGAEKTLPHGASIVYKPPMRGAPTNRISGGARGGAIADIPTLVVLAPDHTGLTIRDQPTLYGFLSAPPDKGYIEFSLIEEHAVAPLIERRIAANGRLITVSLASEGVRLKPDTDYLWNLALVFDPNNRSLDIVSTGAIRHVAAGDELKKRLAALDPAGQAQFYAEQGYWYDAIEAEESIAAKNDASPEARRQLANLLSQAGLAAATSEHGETPK
ncbi:MAG: DUF928 domain-containing protein [Burkholderiales bacterium]|nr:DUF928 domain-containing protein [Burkholderiales bacterium]